MIAAKHNIRTQPSPRWKLALIVAAGGLLVAVGRGAAQDAAGHWRRAKITSQTGKTIDVLGVSLPNGDVWMLVDANTENPMGQFVRAIDIKSITVLGFTETGGTSRKVNGRVTKKDGKTVSDQSVQYDHNQIGVFVPQLRIEDVEQAMAGFSRAGTKDWTVETAPTGMLHGNVRLKLIKKIEFIE